MDMGYANNLYQPKNIIGYTGDLNNFPTVYFKQGDHFGNIVQKHKNPDNIGRDIVASSSLYQILNSPVRDVLEEYIGVTKIHTSSKTFKAVTNNEELNILSKAITTYQEIKTLQKQNAKNAKLYASSGITFDDLVLDAIIKYEYDILTKDTLNDCCEDNNMEANAIIL